MLAPLIFSLSISTAAAAPSIAYTEGFRAGVCVGLSTECPLAAIKLEYVGEHIGGNIGIGLLQSANLRWYPGKLRGGGAVHLRSFLHGGIAVYPFLGQWKTPDYSVGAGLDLHTGKSGRLILQPSVCALFRGHGEPYPFGALSLVMGF